MGNVHPYLATLTSKKQKKEFRKRFLGFMDEIDEPILYPISDEHIFSVFNIQGRWAGVRYYVELNDAGEFTVTSRKYGSH